MTASGAGGESVTLAGAGARRFEAWHARPDSGRGAGLLILHDMFGPGPVFRRLAAEQAARGRCALVPNLFWRSEPDVVFSYDGPHDEAWARARAFDSDAAVADLRGAIAWLRRSPGCNGKVAALGFCVNGTLAFLAAAGTDIDAAIAFYALGIAGRLDVVPRIACPVQLHYGLADAHVPQREIDAVAQGVAANPAIEVHRYPGAGHSFFNPVRPTFEAAAAALAARRMDALLDRLG
ncbi:MAG TPA: dienelactone hydrolase family protein [Stellaceae bacterium]|nr:dienelactone hydrolase family protein [Stellaceae bacterium]